MYTTELSDARSRFVFLGAAYIIFLASLLLLLEVFRIIFLCILSYRDASQLVYQLKSYIFNLETWIHISLYILSIIFLSIFRTTCMCPYVWQWQVGVMAIFLAWFSVILKCAAFPGIGIYVIMFRKIFGTFLKVLLLAILLVATFGLTFHMTFSEPQYQVSYIAMLCIYPPNKEYLCILKLGLNSWAPAFRGCSTNWIPEWMWFTFE